MNGNLLNVKRVVLRYHGGKWRLAPWLIPQMPEHTVYCEPFGGGASVLLRKPRAKAEIYNDLDSSVVHVFRILRNKRTARELERRIRLTPFAREEFEACYEKDLDRIDAAQKIIMRSFMGFSSDACTREHATGFRAKKNRGQLASHEWQTYPDAIETFVDRLRGVVIENRHAFEVIRTYDSPQTLFLIDPPYLLSTRGNKDHHGYRHELSTADHRMLAMLLHQVKGKVLMCGYWSHLYADLYKGWHFDEVLHYANGAHARQECTWRNYELPAAMEASA